MDVVSSGPSMFAGLFTMLPLEEIVYHGIILGASSSRHTLRETRTHKDAYYPVITGNSNKKECVGAAKGTLGFYQMCSKVDLQRDKTNWNMKRRNQADIMKSNKQTCGVN